MATDRSTNGTHDIQPSYASEKTRTEAEKGPSENDRQKQANTIKHRARTLETGTNRTNITKPQIQSRMVRKISISQSTRWHPTCHPDKVNSFLTVLPAFLKVYSLIHHLIPKLTIIFPSNKKKNTPFSTPKQHLFNTKAYCFFPLFPPLPYIYQHQKGRHSFDCHIARYSRSAPFHYAHPLILSSASMLSLSLSWLWRRWGSSSIALRR